MRCVTQNPPPTLIAAINTGKVHKYITKPWDPDDLRLAVRDALEKM